MRNKIKVSNIQKLQGIDSPELCLLNSNMNLNYLLIIHTRRLHPVRFSDCVRFSCLSIHAHTQIASVCSKVKIELSCSQFMHTRRLHRAESGNCQSYCSLNSCTHADCIGINGSTDFSDGLSIHAHTQIASAIVHKRRHN